MKVEGAFYHSSASRTAYLNRNRQKEVAMELKTADIKEVQNHLYHHRIMTRITMFVIAVAVPWMITQAVTGIIWPVLSFIPMYYLFKAVMLHEQIRERRIIIAWHEWKVEGQEEVIVEDEHDS